MKVQRGLVDVRDRYLPIDRRTYVRGRDLGHRPMRRVQWMKSAGEDDLWRVCLGGLHHSCRGIAFGGGWCREDMIGLAREQSLPGVLRDGAIFDHAFWCLQPQRQAIRESASLPDHVQQEPSRPPLPRRAGRGAPLVRSSDATVVTPTVCAVTCNAMCAALGPITHEACRARRPRRPEMCPLRPRPGAAACSYAAIAMEPRRVLVAKMLGPAAVTIRLVPRTNTERRPLKLCAAGHAQQQRNRLAAATGGAQNQRMPLA